MACAVATEPEYKQEKELPREVSPSSLKDPYTWQQNLQSPSKIKVPPVC